MKKLPLSFYQSDDVLTLAGNLIGKLLFTAFDKQITAGRIVELEAYAGVNDRASHASGGRRTARNEVMYGKGGQAYVYLCYGIHHLFNVVTAAKGTPHAILIRALEPVQGIALMEKRMKRKADHSLTRGPGNLARAMGLQVKHNGLSLLGPEIWLADDGFSYPSGSVVRSPRIGVDYAGEDARLPYRFYVKGNKYVSGKPS